MAEYTTRFEYKSGASMFPWRVYIYRDGKSVETIGSHDWYVTLTATAWGARRAARTRLRRLRKQDRLNEKMQTRAKRMSDG